MRDISQGDSPDTVLKFKMLVLQSLHEPSFDATETVTHSGEGVHAAYGYGVFTCGLGPLRA